MSGHAQNKCVAYYHKVLATLSQNLLAHNKFDETMQQILTAGDLIEKMHIIDGLERDGYLRRPQMLTPRIRKTNEVSTTYRSRGNKEFVRQTNAGYLAALEYYNKSICYAENDSEELGLGYANRSAVYFEIGLLDDCLNNIELAKQSAPARVMEKLMNRAKQCLQLKHSGKIEKPIVEPRLSFPANDEIPFIANCLELQRNEQYGRHITTTTELKPGDVVAIEKAFCAKLDPEFKYLRCENCLKERNYNLRPCTLCVSVMFCGECRDEAFEHFHKIECPVIDLLEKLLCKSSPIMIRTVVRAITSFVSANALIAFLEESEVQDLTVFDFNYKETSSYYAPIHFAVDNSGPDTEFATCILTSLIVQPLLELTELKDKFTTTEEVSALKGLIYRHIKRQPSNSSIGIFFDGKLFGRYSEGIYAFRNLLNHSCAPNLIISSINNQLVYTVSKPIEAGEQLFDNYEYVNFPFAGNNR